MIQPIDYIQTKDKSFHIVNYVMHNVILCTEIYRHVSDPKKHLYDTPLKYKPDTKEYFEKYVRRDKDNIRIINKKDIVKVYYARKAYEENKTNLKGIWKEFNKFFIKLGINDIGIYGSMLLGFDYHTDVDFAIYGTRNRDILKENIYQLHKGLGTAPIYKKTIASRINSVKNVFNSKNSFEKIFRRQWSTIEVGNDIHSTIHFVKENSSIYNPLNPKLDLAIISGVIKKSSGFDFWYKSCDLITENSKAFKVFSTLWPYQSAVEENERVTICGEVDFSKNIIYLRDKKKHYLKIW